MKRVLQAAATAALLAAFAFFSSLTFVTLKAWALREAVFNRLADLQQAGLRTFDGDPSSKSLDGRLTLRAAVLKRVDTLSETANEQLTTMQRTVRGAVVRTDAQLSAVEGLVTNVVEKADLQLTEAQGTVKNLGAKVDPVLEAYTRAGNELAGAVKDGRKLATDSQNDWWNMLQSSEVLVTSGARAADNLAQEMPKYTEQAKRIGDSAVRVGEAAAAEAAEFTKPQTTRQKIGAWLSIIPRVVKLVL